MQSSDQTCGGLNEECTHRLSYIALGSQLFGGGGAPLGYTLGAHSLILLTACTLCFMPAPEDGLSVLAALAAMLSPPVWIPNLLEL